MEPFQSAGKHRMKGQQSERYFEVQGQFEVSPEPNNCQHVCYNHSMPTEQQVSTTARLTGSGEYQPTVGVDRSKCRREEGQAAYKAGDHLCP
eukprot:m.29477 g.29477  ORF g.29477 m.29477 type:complete len:92 (-) comp11945_c0_seq1:649-924(-)